MVSFLKMKNVPLLATQAYLTGAVIESTLKYLSGRTRPSFIAPAKKPGQDSRCLLAILRDFNGNKSNSSFPSGQTSVAFVAATVFAMEYKNTLWVPIFSYSAASLISLSRITEKNIGQQIFLLGQYPVSYLAGRSYIIITGMQN